MSALAWMDACDAVLARIRGTQRENIAAAADFLAETAARKGAVYYYDTGHCAGEPVHRAGGLFMVKRFSYSVSVTDGPPPARRADPATQAADALRREEEDAHLAIDRSVMAAGDALIIVSVSGKMPGPVELALAAREKGLRVIAITNVAYSKSLASKHSSERRLCEVADVTIDNCGVIGDAILDLPGLEAPFAPTSGVTTCYLLWALFSEAAARMVARGLTPHVFLSINLERGAEFNEKARQDYEREGI